MPQSNYDQKIIEETQKLIDDLIFFTYLKPCNTPEIEPQS